MKYELTDEEVDRMVGQNKQLHIELAATKSELQRLQLAVTKEVVDVFNADCAPNDAIAAVRTTLAMTAANKTKLIRLLIEQFGVPGKKEACSVLGVVGRVLISLENMATPTAEGKDVRIEPPSGLMH